MYKASRKIIVLIFLRLNKVEKSNKKQNTYFLKIRLISSWPNKFYPSLGF